MLIPASCKTMDSFKGVDPKSGIEISTKEIIPITMPNYQGKPRQANLTVYCLKKDKQVRFEFAIHL